MVFFLLFSIYIFRGKQRRSLTLNYCVFFHPVQHLASNVFEGEHKVIFFLYDCYVLGHYRRSKYNHQKIPSIFDTNILIENLLLIIPYNIYGIAHCIKITCAMLAQSAQIWFLKKTGHSFKCFLIRYNTIKQSWLFAFNVGLGVYLWLAGQQ